MLQLRANVGIAEKRLSKSRSAFGNSQESRALQLFSIFVRLQQKVRMPASPVFILTGASRGIGKATALAALTKFNARVVAVARSAELLGELQSEAAKLGKGDSIALVTGDVTDNQTIKQSVTVALEKWGQIHGLIANAG